MNFISQNITICIIFHNHTAFYHTCEKHINTLFDSSLAFTWLVDIHRKVCHTTEMSSTAMNKLSQYITLFHFSWSYWAVYHIPFYGYTGWFTTTFQDHTRWLIISLFMIILDGLSYPFLWSHWMVYHFSWSYWTIYHITFHNHTGRFIISHFMTILDGLTT